MARIERVLGGSEGRLGIVIRIFRSQFNITTTTAESDFYVVFGISTMSLSFHMSAWTLRCVLLSMYVPEPKQECLGILCEVFFSL